MRLFLFLRYTMRMVTTLISDLSNVLLFSKDKTYTGKLNALYKDKKQEEAFSFYNFYTFNQELLDYFKRLQIEKHIFTSGLLQEDPAAQEVLTPVFESIISGVDIKYDKSDARAYSHIIGELGKSPSEVIFVDDTAGNIVAARSAGLNGVHYVNNAQVIQDIDTLLR